MKKLIFAVFIIICALSCKGKPVEAGADEAMLAKVDSILASMDVQRKVAQLFIVQIDRNNPAKTRMRQDSLVRMGLGGIIIMRGPVAPFMERMNELQGYAQIPLLTCTDAEWGAAMRFPAEYMDYPRQFQLGKIDDAGDIMYRMGLNVGQELKDLNIYVNFAPVGDLMDVPSEAGSQREFGTDKKKAAAYSVAYMKGMQDAGIFACGKHYPGNGDTPIDAHVDMPVFDYSRETMDTLYLEPFKAMVDNGVSFIMVGHCCYPSIDSTMIPMSISSACVTDLLKGEMGFKGIVTTDALGMGGVAKGRTSIEVSVGAYKAGIDMLLMPRDPIECINAIADSVATGVFSMEDLDNRVRKVLTYKAKAGFFDEGYSPIVENLDEKVAAARLRDSLLIDEMWAAIKASKIEVEKATVDPTLQMDEGVDK